MVIAAAVSFSCSQSESEELRAMIDNAFNDAAERYIALSDKVEADFPGQLPFSMNPDSTLKATPVFGWTSGFFPGSLWYIYENTASEPIRERAERFTSMLEDQKDNTTTHDIGFMIFCSFGNADRLFPSEHKDSVIIDAANTLCTRFNETVGCIQSWDSYRVNGWGYPVIIDNMMNLELLMWASNKTGDDRYRNVADTHAQTTMKNHFRPDCSSYHVVNYDAQTGEVLWRGTHQGKSDDSSWARGQGWGLYGFTMMYRFTSDPQYLEHAQKIAAYIMDYPDMPEDKIPLWDFKARPDSPRDASAAALYASALLELEGYVEDKAFARRCHNYAVDILRTLSGPEYTAKKGGNAGFLLKHSVTAFPLGKEIDKPLNYADYYYFEALLRLKSMLAED